MLTKTFKLRLHKRITNKNIVNLLKNVTTYIKSQIKAQLLSSLVKERTFFSYLENSPSFIINPKLKAIDSTRKSRHVVVEKLNYWVRGNAQWRATRVWLVGIRNRQWGRYRCGILWAGFGEWTGWILIELGRLIIYSGY